MISRTNSVTNMNNLRHIIFADEITLNDYVGKLLPRKTILNVVG